MWKWLFILLSIFLTQYFFYFFTENNKKKFFLKYESSFYLVTYSIHNVYLTTHSVPYPNHTKIRLHKNILNSSTFPPRKGFIRNYIMIDENITKKINDIYLKSPMDYYIISNCDLDDNVEILFYNKNHPNIILEITPEGYVIVERNIFTRSLLNLISWGGPLRKQVLDNIFCPYGQCPVQPSKRTP